MNNKFYCILSVYNGRNNLDRNKFVLRINHFAINISLHVIKIANNLNIHSVRAVTYIVSTRNKGLFLYMTRAYSTKRRSSLFATRCFTKSSEFCLNDSELETFTKRNYSKRFGLLRSFACYRVCVFCARR